MVNQTGPVGAGSAPSAGRPAPAVGTPAPGTSAGEAPSFSEIQREAIQRRESTVGGLQRQGPASPGGGTDLTGDMPPPSAGEHARLHWAAQQLEALLVHELLKSMRKTVPETGMFDSPATKMFEEMLDEERANEMVRNGGMGLADLIYEQMSRHLPPEDEDRT